MIAEYDDMVGEYIAALHDSGLYDSTIIILSSDHGDMQMQHRQFYKMSAYEVLRMFACSVHVYMQHACLQASTRIPIVIGGGPRSITKQRGGNVATLVSLVDLLPTVLEIGRYKDHAPPSSPPLELDGTSLVPLLRSGDGASHTHPDHVVSQHHGENMVMSWYMIRQGSMKYIAWGTGKEHPPQLFNLSADPSESRNLAVEEPSAHAAAIAQLDALLRKSIDYPSVSMKVADYNIKMARWWMADEPNWRAVLNGTANSTHHTGAQSCLASQKAGPGHNQAPAAWYCKGGSDWGEVWQNDNEKYLQAWMDWVQAEPKIVPCPDTLTYGV